MNSKNAFEIQNICGRYGARFSPDTPAAPYTTFRIGGNCNIIEVNGDALLSELLTYCDGGGITRRILGKGSNVLISDKGLDGVVLLMGGEFAEIGVENTVIRCKAGASLFDVCRTAADNALTGLEFAYGIPGTVGGALYMNAGAYGGEMKDIVNSCRYIESGEEREADASALDLSYRHSVFCGSDAVITDVTLKLEKGCKAAIVKKMSEIMQKRRDKQPLDYPSAGSTFKRPEGYFAAKLIDECGLRGRTVGGAEVSEKHCGFIVNKGGATFDDVTRLIDLVRDEVLAKTGVSLECEVKIWNS